MGTKKNILLFSRKIRFTFRNILDGTAVKLTTRSTAKVVVFLLVETVFYYIRFGIQRWPCATIN